RGKPANCERTPRFVIERHLERNVGVRPVVVRSHFLLLESPSAPEDLQVVCAELSRHGSGKDILVCLADYGAARDVEQLPEPLVDEEKPPFGVLDVDDGGGIIDDPLKQM